jgi:hypothetical protein
MRLSRLQARRAPQAAVAELSGIVGGLRARPQIPDNETFAHHSSPAFGGTSLRYASVLAQEK